MAMTFAEIDDSEESDISAHLLSEDEDETIETFAASVAERAKDRSRAAKQFKLSKDIQPETRDVSSEEAVVPPSRLKKRAAPRTLTIDEDEDDLTRVADHSQKNELSNSTNSQVTKQKSKLRRQSRALDKYQVIPDEPAEVRTSRRSAAKKSTNYAPLSDLAGNELPSASHVAPTPNLPTPQVEVKIHEMISPADPPRSSRKRLTGNVEDSQTPMKSSEDRIQVRASSSIDQKPSIEAHPEFSVVMRQRTNDVDELVSCTAFNTTPSIQTGSVENSDVHNDDDKLSISGQNSHDIDRRDKVKARSKKRIIDGDDGSDATESDDEPQNRPVLKATKRKRIKEPAKANDPKTARAKVETKVEHLEPDTSTSIVMSIEEEASIKTEQAPRHETVCQNLLPVCKDEKPAIDTKVINYAATTIIKSFSGPRHRVGLSRRQRVEPLHANIRRDV